MPRYQKPFVLHPFLLALYPVIYLYAANAGEARPGQLWFPSGILLGLAGLLFLIGLTLFREAQRAGVLTSALLVAFCFYGQVSRPLGQVHLLGMTPFRHRLLVPVLGCGLVALVITLYRRRTSWAGVTSALNGIASLLVGLAIVQVLWAGFSSPARDLGASIAQPIQVRSQVADRPDIYVIIADEYARTDLFRETFGVDDSAFLEDLRSLGFVVARNSVTNYSRTTPSLASFLNVDYLPGLRPDDPLEPPRDPEWASLIRQNRVMRFVRDQGYRTNSYVSSWTATQGIVDLDAEIDSTPHFNEFTGLLIRGSFISFLQDVMGLANLDPESSHRDRVLNILDDLETRPGDPHQPTFTFAHVPAPHEPFVLNPDGSLIERAEKERLGFKNSFFYSPPEAQERMYRAFYPGQAQFVAGRLVEIARSILNRPGPKPIILIASDHGSWLSWVRLPHAQRHEPSAPVVRERFPNMVALHMPGVHQEDLDNLSLVNVLRLVLSRGLQAELPRLPDRCFFVGKHLREVTGMVRANQGTLR